MASTKLTFLAIVVLLLQSSWCALSQQGGTAAVMAVTSFEADPDASPAACDGLYHNNGDMLASLSTQWYEGGIRCLKRIQITSLQNVTNSVVALVVDECGSESGCEDNIIATSRAVWDALWVDQGAGEVPISWIDTNA